MNALRALLEDHDQIVQEIDGGNDYGEDLFVMFTKDGYRTGVSIVIQVKSGEKYRRANGYAIPVDEHGDDWKNSLLPVFGVVFDVDARRLFWVNLTERLEAPGPPSWIQVDSSQELTELTVAEFVQQAHLYAEKRAEAGSNVSLQVYSITANSDQSVAFVGRREEQCRLRRILCEGESRKILIVGMAGAGKTALIDQVARTPDLHATFTGGVIFVDMQGFSGDRRHMGRPSAAYAPILIALGFPPSEVPADVNGQAATYHNFLEAQAKSGRDTLFVFDNVAEVSQVAELIPKSSTHGTVVTSRVRLGIIDGLETFPLECMGPEESEELFRSILPAEGLDLDSETVQQLCDLCGHLPLALRISGAIAREDMPFDLSSFVEELTEERNRLDVLEYGDSAVRAALQVSFSRLNSESRVAFCKISVNPGTSISETIAEEVLELPSRRVRTTLRKLGQASLITRDPESARWRMHDLVYLFSSEKAEQVIDQGEYMRCFMRIAKRYEEISEEADSALRGIVAKDVRFKTPPDALTWFDQEHVNLRATALRSRDAGMSECTFYLLMHLVLYFDVRVRVNDALQCAISAHDAARELKDAERQVRALNNIGLALTSQRRFKEAIQKLKKSNAIAERIGFNEGECDSIISLGSAIRQYEGPRAAIPVLIRAKHLAKRSGDSGSIATALTNLGSALREAGQLVPAAQALSESVMFHRKSGDRRREASALGGLGAALSDMGQFDAAIESFKKAFSGYEEVQDFFGINLNWANLGATYLAKMDVEQANKCLTRAMEYFISVDDAFHQGLCLMNLGNSALAGGDFFGARGFFLRARENYKRCAAPAGVLAADSALRKIETGKTSR